MSDGSLEHAGSCYCSSVKVSVTGTFGKVGVPVFFASNVTFGTDQRLVRFPKDNVRIEGELTVSQVGTESEHASCKVCGGCAANRKLSIIKPVKWLGF